jgi:hypothetical protein
MSSLDTRNLERYLESFGRQVVADSKELLQSAKGSTALGGSIRFKVVATSTGFDTMFYMEDYGTYLDKGVSGNKQERSYKDYKGVTRVSDYSYTNKQPPPDILSKWIKKKGIKPKGLGRGRDKNTGQFISNLAFIIGKKIKRDGIKSLSFFQKPLGLGITALEKNMLKEIKLDIQQYLVTFTK